MLDSYGIISGAVFVACAATAWLLLDYFQSGGARTADRLQEINEPRRRSEAKHAARADDVVAKVIEKASPTLSRPLTPVSEAERSLLKQRLDHAGFRSELAAPVFLSLKLAGLLLGFVLCGGTLLFSGLQQNVLLRVGTISCLLFYVPDVIVWYIARYRQQAIFLGLPDALDLMVVCVEAGLGLDQAMRKVAEEMKKSHWVLGAEFAVCNFQLQMGKPRRDVLQNLGTRTGVDDLRSLATVLIQAEKFGASVSQALRVQSDSMRTRRRQMAEEKAAKTAVQLIFPLVLFIFPGIFVVLVGPAAITMIREMFPMMAGGR